MIDLDLVEVQFNQCLTQDKTDVNLDTYILAYEEIIKIFGCLGSVFGFVTTDVEKKISIIRSKMSAAPDQYQTCKSMLLNEISQGVITADSNNGSRTLLRLHRALDFIAEFMKMLGEGDGSNIAGPVWSCYSATLGKHHTWLIRNTVSMATYTLPQRQKILEQVGRKGGELASLVVIMRDVYSAMQNLYNEHGLLNLK